jgi:hypothetical protein
MGEEDRRREDHLMDTLATAAALPPNTLGTGALIFLALAWTSVLTLTFWAFRRLLTTPEPDALPPPGSIP